MLKIVIEMDLVDYEWYINVGYDAFILIFENKVFLGSSAYTRKKFNIDKIHSDETIKSTYSLFAWVYGPEIELKVILQVLWWRCPFPFARADTIKLVCNFKNTMFLSNRSNLNSSSLTNSNMCYKHFWNIQKC